MPPFGPARRARAPFALLVLPTAGALAACGKDPVVPPPPPPPPASVVYDSATVAGSIARSSYTDTLLEWENFVFFWRDRVDWPRQQAAVRAQVAAATTHGGLWRAAEGSIDPWLVEAPPEGQDLHSAFFSPDIAPGLVDSPNQPRFQVVGDALTRTLAAGPGRVAYLWFPNYSGRNATGRVDSTQAVIRALDQSAPCGWVLDQRFNYGGDIAAMMSGLSPLIGDAPASATQNGLGGFVFSDSSRGILYLQNGQLGTYDPSDGRRYPYSVRPTQPYQLQRPNSPVAILLSPITASAGELITIAFRGSAVPHRSFGANTLGLTTGPVGIYLRPDSGYLNITASVMFDRLGRQYGSVLTPDEPVAGPSWRDLRPATVISNGDPVLTAAVQWLQAQPACTGAPVASRAPDLSRQAAAVKLPGQAKPNDFVRRVSRYFMPRGGERALGGR